MDEKKINGHSEKIKKKLKGYSEQMKRNWTVTLNRWKET